MLDLSKVCWNGNSLLQEMMSCDGLLVHQRFASQVIFWPGSLAMAEWFQWYEVMVFINQVWILSSGSSTKVAGFMFSRKVVIWNYVYLHCISSDIIYVNDVIELIRRQL